MIRAVSDLRWSEVREDWEDGSNVLRDIYVLSTTEDDWQRVLDLVRASGWPSSYTEGDNPAPLPTKVGEIFERTSGLSVLLRIWPTEGVAIHCHFFVPDEIEFDVSPREVTGQTQLDAVCGFVRAIGKALDKPVLVTWESTPSEPIMRYQPGTDAIDRVLGTSPWWE
jgi:hypothetical protein